MKCKNLSLNEKIAVLDYAKQHPSQVYRKIAEHFNVSKTATAIILKEEKRLWEEFKFLADDHKSVSTDNIMPSMKLFLHGAKSAQVQRSFL